MKKLERLNSIFAEWDATIFSSLLSNSEEEFNAIWEKAKKLKEQWRKVLHEKE